MKFRFEFIYRLGLVLLAIVAFWAILANAQPSATTNSPPAKDSLTSTNEFQGMTFGLDNVDWLKKHTALGEPLWKYLASLIYLVLA